MTCYEIRLAGRLDPGWSEWFEGFTLTADAEQHTILTGPVIDQAALHGLLRRVGDLGMDLIAINILTDAMPPAPSESVMVWVWMPAPGTVLEAGHPTVYTRKS